MTNAVGPMVDITGTPVIEGVRVAVAGQMGDYVIMRVGKVDEVYFDKYNVPKVRVDWKDGRGKWLPERKTSVGLDRVVVLLDRPTASA